VRRRVCLHLVRHHIAARSGCGHRLKEVDGILWLRVRQEVHHVTTHRAIEQAEALVYRHRAHLYTHHKLA
jgi:hypothetical protein